MGLDIASLKYFEACNDKYINLNKSYSSEIITSEDYKKEAERMVFEHNQKTDSMVNQYKKLHKLGQISDSEYRMATLEAIADDLVYQLGINSLYGT